MTRDQLRHLIDQTARTKALEGRCRHCLRSFDELGLRPNRKRRYCSDSHRTLHHSYWRRHEVAA